MARLWWENPENWDAYLPPSYNGRPLPALPEEGEFCLTVKTNKRRLDKMMNVLGQFWSGNFYNSEHIIDMWRALYFFDRPELLGCNPPEPLGDECCQTFAPYDDLIRWEPQDPFRQPNLRPRGYRSAPFSAITGDNIITDPDAEVNDVFTNFEALPTAPELIGTGIITGFPRFSVTVEGEGYAYIHLLKIPFGGLALINVDNSLTQNNVVDMQTIGLGDFLSPLELIGAVGDLIIEGSLIEEYITRVELRGDTEHVINITFLPKIDLPNIAGFGGGFRKILVCGARAARPRPQPVVGYEPLPDVGALIDPFQPVSEIWGAAFGVPIPIPVPFVLDGAGDCASECECEDMSCNCGGRSGAVRYCDGKLEYYDGQNWVAVPNEAITPSSIPPVPVVPLPPPDSGNIEDYACYKANAAWSVIRDFVSGSLDVLDDASSVGGVLGAITIPGSAAGALLKFNRVYPDLDNNSTIMGSTLATALLSGNVQEMIDNFVANHEAIGVEFVCAAQDRFEKNDRLSIAEIAWILAYSWDTGSSVFNDIIRGLTLAVERHVWVQRSYSFVQQATGECNCVGSAPNTGSNSGNGQIPVGCARWGGNIQAAMYPLNNINNDQATITMVKALPPKGTGASGLLKTTNEFFSQANQNGARGGAVYELVGDLQGVSISAVVMLFRLTGGTALNFEAVIGFASGDNDPIDAVNSIQFGGAVPPGNRVLETNPLWTGGQNVNRMYIGFEANSNPDTVITVELLSLTLDYSVPDLPAQDFRMVICPS